MDNPKTSPPPSHAWQFDVFQFDTGAVRSREGEKERWDLIPFLGLWRLARTCAEGAARYGECNWLRGIPIGNLLTHALRHVYFYLAGDRSEDHLAHAAWNLLAACHMEIWPELSKVIPQIPADHPIWSWLRGQGGPGGPEGQGRPTPENETQRWYWLMVS